MKQILLILSLALLSPFTGNASAAGPSPTDTVSAELALLDTLEVAPGGTLAFRDEAAARAILGPDWAAATAEMDALNGRIRAGQVEPFASTSELASYHLKEPGTCTPVDPASVTTPTPTLGSSATPITVDESAIDANCFCSKKCCTSNMCCSSGWWYFCWKYGSC